MEMILEQPEAELSDYEIERGKPMPGKAHARTQSRLIGEFLEFREKYDILSEFDLKLDPDLPKRVPDISILPLEELDYIGEAYPQTEPPEMVVEILSPSQGSGAVLKGTNYYLDNGVKSVWVVTPPLKIVTIRLADGTLKNYEGGTVTDPVTGITANLDRVFS